MNYFGIDEYQSDDALEQEYADYCMSNEAEAITATENVVYVHPADWDISSLKQKGE